MEQLWFIKDSEDFAVSFAFVITFVIGVFFLPAGREFAKRLVAHTSWWGVPAVIYTEGKNGDFVIEKLMKNIIQRKDYNMTEKLNKKN